MLNNNLDTNINIEKNLDYNDNDELLGQVNYNKNLNEDNELFEKIWEKK
jgi:hypothetical protein